MMTSTQRFFLLIVGLLFCILGCARDRAQVLMPDDISPPMEVPGTAHAKVSFEENILPILTSKCALAGCHVADGPHGLDFRTYESFIAGGEHGPAFIPGNAEESEVVEEVVEGKMPPPESGRPTLSAVELQTLKDWINQQETKGDIVKHEHGDAHADAEDAHDDMDAAHDDAEDAHDDMDDAHDDAEDAHDDMDAAHHGMDDAHDADADNGHDANDADNGHGHDDAHNGHDADDAHDDDHN